MGLTARRNARTARRFFSRTVIVNVWRLIAIVLLIWGEFGVYFWSLSSCRWPTTTQSAVLEKPTHILLLSDTQVELPAANRKASWAKSLHQLTYNLYLKRAWRVTMRMNPNVVFFLGDMLVDGKKMQSEQEYKEYYHNFLEIFQTPDADIYYLPGNNDVGMGTTRPLYKDVRKAFLQTFGPFNQQVDIHNHTFVLLDAPGLVDEDYTRAAQGVDYNDWTPLSSGPVEFVKDTDIDTHDNPIILLSHIPLWRKDTAPCGPHREKGNIHKGVGHGYQNTLQKHTTEFLISHLSPSIIFSGDNLDHCEHIHRLSVSSHLPGEVVIPEVTVKSFSPTRHIRRPGFQLLSLYNSNPTTRTEQSFAYDLCLLPDQTFIHWRLYPGFACLVILFLAVFNLWRRRRLHSHVFLPPLAPRNNLTGMLSSHHSSHPSLVTATWTSYTPPTPTSPLSSLPGTIRTPNAFSGPTFRSASRPETPNHMVHPLLSPMPYTHEEAEDDSLYPPQYANTGYMREEETWSPDHLDHLDNHENGSIMTPFLSTPKKQPWSWSWSFVFRGRRHRMTIRAPSFSWEALKDLLAFLGEGVAGDAKFKRRGVIRQTMMDFLSVSWAFSMIWLAMAWWSF